MRRFAHVLRAVVFGLVVQLFLVLLATMVGGVGVVEYAACTVVAVFAAVWSYRDSRRRVTVA
ncbi:MAG: hypothetical protein WKF94_06910 [Solirubrobacteraceae bacterium]